MSHTPVGGHPQGWEHKLADRSSLPPAPGEEKIKSQIKHVFAQPHLSKMAWREETEGSSGSSGRSATSPPYMRWARSLHALLEDAEGVRLFRKFVSSAGGLHVDRLNFYFAVQGLRQESDPSKIRQVVSAIYKFLRKSQLTMPEALRSAVKTSLRDGAPIERTIFDNMEQEVTRAITETTYPAFLRSEAYVSYVSAATQPLSSPDASPPHALAHAHAHLAHHKDIVGGGLATLHEGEELAGAGAGAGVGPAVGGGGGAPARLTHDALLATQTRRLHSDAAPHRRRWVYSAHAAYAGYCPASRHDSERASLSSGRTDSDIVSLSGSSLDGMSLRGGEAAVRAHRERERERERHRRGAPLDQYINKEHDTGMVIPRTQRIQSEQLRVLPPSEFAPLLIEKLERVRRDQESKDRLERRLAEGEGEDASTQALPPQLVAAAIREKLQLDDDNDQDILDQHVSRVWSERTPGGSPPPRRAPRAPPRARAPSALSADSGHYEGPPDHHHHPHPHPHPHQLSRRSFSSSKKTVTELTDSGVSVVSEGTASAAGVEPRILLWIAEGSERMERAERAERPDRERERRHRDLSSRGSSADRDDRRRDKNRPRVSGSKSSSTSGGGGGGAAASKEPAGAGAAGAGGEHTVVVVTFLDENVPYRFKVPAAPLTLKTFKEYLPRKGNYRYFFKTECADLDNTVIQEEVSCDHDTLPMYDNKVMARVKTID